MLHCMSTKHSKQSRIKSPRFSFSVFYKGNLEERRAKFKVLVHLSYEI